MSKKSVLRRNSISKFSVGDHYGKLVCEEDATCELKVLFEVYVKTSRMEYWRVRL
jgi:hypothetical protein